MMLVADHTVTGCLIMLAEDLNADRWTVLNWKVVLNEPGRFFGYSGKGTLKTVGTPTEEQSNGLKEPIRIRPTSDVD